jgi:hypothetical protein
MPIRDTDVSKCNSVAPLFLPGKRLWRLLVATAEAKYMLNQYVVGFFLSPGRGEDFNDFS